MVIATKITLPTVDVVTDALSIHKVFSFEGPSHDRTVLHAVGYAMICVMVLSLIMTIPHFLRVEKSWRQRLKGLPFLMLSSWPQYRGFRLLWLAHWKKNETKFKEEQKEEEETLSHIGKKLFNHTLSNMEPGLHSTYLSFPISPILDAATFRYSLVYWVPFF